MLAETAKLHAGDPENRALWERFMPVCLAEIERLYRRLDVSFDHQLGESFFQPMLAGRGRGSRGHAAWPARAAGRSACFSTARTSRRS